MHILILASTVDATEKIQSALSGIAHRCSIAETWADVLTLLKGDSPDLLLVERGSLAQMELATLSNLTEPGRWPPLLLVDGTGVGVRDGVVAAQHLARAALPSYYRVGELRVDTRKKRAGFGDRWVTLPPIQYRLLLALARQAGEVIEYQELMREVWGYKGEDSEARELLKVHVRQIRRRLGLDPERSYYIRSVRGFGYMLVSPDEED
jgi:two-component system KDP operon response regulator KdpE